jgi:ATP/maltotriose-dependent transcriptional regulator MalT
VVHNPVVGTEDKLSEAARLDDEGYDAFVGGDTETARRLHTRSLELAREAAEPSAVASALAGLMRLALREKDFDGLSHLVSEAEAVAQESGDESLYRYPLHMKAEGARMQGHLADARQAYIASLALNGRLGNDNMVAVESGNLAWVEIAEGNLDEAERLISECETATSSDDSYGLAFVLLTKARINLEKGDQTASRLLSEADRTLETAGLVWDPTEQETYEKTKAMVEPPQ